MKKPSRSQVRPYEAIRGDELLPLSVLRTRLHWGARTVAQAQKEGLRVARFGRWAYVTGADLIDFLRTRADA